MKRFILIFTLFLTLFVFTVPGWADWTITETVFYRSPDRTQTVIKLACTSDASGTDYQLTAGRVIGKHLYSVQTDPGDGADAPAGVYTLDVEDSLNFHLLDLDGLSTSAVEVHLGSATLGLYPHMDRLPSVVLSTLGDGNKTDIYLTFVD